MMCCIYTKLDLFLLLKYLIFLFLYYFTESMYGSHLRFQYSSVQLHYTTIWRLNMTPALPNLAEKKNLRRCSLFQSFSVSPSALVLSVLVRVSVGVYE